MIIKKQLFFTLTIILFFICTSILTNNIFSITNSLINEKYSLDNKIKPGKEDKKTGTHYFTKYRKIKGNEIDFNDKDEIKKDEAETLPKYYKVEFNSKGKVKKISKFEQNKLEPYLEIGWKGNKVDSQTYFIDGLKSQKHYFNSNGNIAKVEFYQRGELFGIRFYRNGVKTKEQFISDGKVIDERLY